MIEIIHGSAFYSDGILGRTITVGDPPVSLDPEVEARWVAEGFARYVSEPEEQTCAEDAVEDEQPTDPPADDGGEEPLADGEEDGGEDEDEEDDGEEPIDYSTLKVAELKELAKERNIPIPARAKQAEIVELLTKSDAPPVIEAQEVDE